MNTGPSLHILDANTPLPAGRVIYCDGGMHPGFREGIDLELSHWIPNRTPHRYKANTSTEIAMRFAATAADRNFDLVVNNHVDVDGVLCTFVVLHPEIALQHRDAIVQAAEMGDFGGWGAGPAQYLFDELVRLMDSLEGKIPADEIYARCHECARAVLNESSFSNRADMEPIRNSVERLSGGMIARSQITERFAHYAIPREIAEHNIEAALTIAEANAPLSVTLPLLPNVRAKLDRERVHLISAESRDGTYYDVHLPGYVWAETVGLWRPPGLFNTGNSNRHEFFHAPLDAAIAQLQKLEAAQGDWRLAHELSAFTALPGRRFPVVACFMRDDRPAPSALPAEVVVQELSAAFS